MNKNHKILIAEDDQIFARSLKSLFTEHGFANVKVVSTGEDLISNALQFMPHLIITDITLKGNIDGIEALARIEELKEIPFIFITGYSEYLSLIESYNLTPLKTFVKPIDFNELYEVSNRLFIKDKSTMSHYYLG